MSKRILKIVLVAFVALGALFWAVQNVVNLGVAYDSVAYVTSNVDHLGYPATIAPSFSSPLLIWAALLTILACEFATGLLAARGAWDMFVGRQAAAADFNASKNYAILGCGMAVVTWFGVFGVIGGAFFQMWQTEIGHGSFADGVMYAIANGIVLLFVDSEDN